jgi:glycosyltransferase involved in cell wall biosynthesis
MRGCLEDLTAQTLGDRLEIIVVDSASPQNERAIVEEFQQRHRNIVYVRTEERETLFKAWNRAIKIARGKYLTNANTDDRHVPDALEKLSRALDGHPEAGVAYAGVDITLMENGRPGGTPLIGCFKARKFNRRRLFWDCLPGPQPMWRRELHDRFGLFDESFVAAGDYEFWLRLSGDVRFLHIPEVLGLYLKSPTSIMHSNAAINDQETRLARERYWPGEWGKIPADTRPLLRRLMRRDTYIKRIRGFAR